MQEIHNTKKRMPVILSKINKNDWLSGNYIDNFKNIDVALIAMKIPSNNSNRSQLSFFN